jgi:hypothetical protein
MMHSKHFGQSPHVTVYISYDYHFSYNKIVTFRISAGGWGLISIADADAYCKAMSEAVAYAKQCQKSFEKAINEGKTHEEWMQENFPELFE